MLTEIGKANRNPGLNLTGFVWTVDQDTHHTVTVEFYDHEYHRDFHFTDPYLYDKACLSMLLYRSKQEIKADRCQMKRGLYFPVLQPMAIQRWFSTVLMRLGQHEQIGGRSCQPEKM